MAFTSLRLQNFRSYVDGSFEFEDGVNIIVGPNGAGKTNLLEALLMLTNGSSYRGRDFQMVKYGSDWARLDGWLVGEQLRILKLQDIDGDRVDKTFEIGANVLKRLTPARRLPVVVFEPNHLFLLQDEPAARREYIDLVCEQIDPGFEKTKRDFKRVLAQRNSLLKAGVAESQFFVWDVQFCQLAEKLTSARVEAILEINKLLTKTYKQLGGKVGKLEIIYQSKIPIDDNYSNQLMRSITSHRQQEQERGFTIYGPQRDDITLLFDGIDARQRASRGETRTVLLALKIIEIELIAQRQKPILLLDDVFSELDGHRRRA
ncbi:MAG: DNA replication and repair protein RecF, partial [bacterium]|nr:DNA replication and repair protein RecF [bacterium]